MNIKTCKTFAKISFYLILFGFFLKFYFIEEIQDYLAGKTTFATSYEDRKPRKPQIQVFCYALRQITKKIEIGSIFSMQPG